ncbi:NADAR family protein [Amphritea sp. 1_MG-2023]|uniref:NADAR family protein n=1 Tax=Amphritea sp. 1_MG-2023 TaxID=3062670 RepID=UPI0026E16763|nr:NADAR family protein [Amphritea sp. 1_MG-2023]MDO6561878.1 NADAR family protein [Amphritea sp. 1_MG-2023]
MFFKPKEEPKRLIIQRNDPNNPLAAYANHAFELDGYEWPSVEHYYQAMKFADTEYAEQIRQAASPAEAMKLGKSKQHNKRKDWDKVKVTVMTRGTYIKCRTYPEIAQQLLDSGDIHIADLSQYDYFWGSGRDMRGNNAFGQMLMEIRNKLTAERQPA